MQVVLNGQPEEVAGGSTVRALLEKLELNPDIVTVTVNERYLDKQALGTHSLADGDRVEVILFMGGGW